MDAKFFVDENDLGLGRLLADEYKNVIYPGHPDLPDVPRGAVDDDWLRVVGQLQLVVITRDRKTRSTLEPHELARRRTAHRALDVRRYNSGCTADRSEIVNAQEFGLPPPSRVGEAADLPPS